jgi:hypothetical protein
MSSESANGKIPDTNSFASFAMRVLDNFGAKSIGGNKTSYSVEFPRSEPIVAKPLACDPRYIPKSLLNSMP